MSSPSHHLSIAANLRDDILRGQYRCGERLPSERDLAQRFGVHRSAVREAFKRLEQLGVATIQPGGARVAPIDAASLDIVEHIMALDDPPDPEMIDQALEAKSAFRAMAARLGTERASDVQRARMLEILEAMRRPDLGSRERADLVEDLAECFVEASENMIFRLISHSLPRPPERLSEAFGLVAGSPNQVAVDAHLESLSKAIETADGAVASEVIYELSCLLRKNLRALSSAESEPTSAALRSGEPS